MLKFFIRALNRKTIFLFISAIVSVLTIFVLKYWNLILLNSTLFGYIVSTIFALLGLSVKYPKLYMYIVYIKALIFGEDTIWNLSARYKGQILNELFEELCGELEKISERVSIHNKTNSLYKATLDGINVFISITDKEIDDFETEHDEEQQLHFQIVDFRAPYEDTLKLLEYTIEPYLSKINSIIKPDKTDFELSIIFKNGNPWAKAVSKGINYEDILAMDFLIKINENKKVKGEMHIGKKDLRITCRDLGALSKLIKARLMPIN